MKDLSYVKRIKILNIFFIGILPFELNGLYNYNIIRYPFVYWVIDFITWIVLPIMIYIYGLKRNLFTNVEIGFKSYVKEKWNKYINVLLLIGLSVIISSILYNIYLKSWSTSIKLFPVNIGEINFDYATTIPSKGAGRILIILFYALTGGFAEEFYYRSLFSILFSNKSISIILYVILSSLIFSSAHWEGGIRKIFATFIFGVVSAVIYRCIKNIWPLAIGHAIEDYILLS